MTSPELSPSRKDASNSTAKLQDVNITTITVISIAFFIVLLAFYRIDKFLQSDVEPNIQTVANNSELARDLASLDADINHLMTTYLRRPKHLEQESLWIKEKIDDVRILAATSQGYTQGRIPLQLMVDYQGNLLKLIDSYQSINTIVLQLDDLYHNFFTYLNEMEEYTSQVMVKKALAGQDITVYNQILALIPFNREQVLQSQLLLEKALAAYKPIFPTQSEESGDYNETIETMLQTFRQTSNTLTSAEDYVASRAQLLVQHSDSYQDLLGELNQNLISMQRADNQVRSFHDQIIGFLKLIDERTTQAIDSLHQRTRILLSRVRITIYAISTIVLLVYFIGWNLIKKITRQLLDVTDQALQTTKMLEKSNNMLEDEIAERTKAEKNLQIRSQFQTSLNSLLQLSLHNLYMQDILKKFIEETTAISWLGVEPKGAIFLTDTNGKKLVMQANHNLDQTLLTKCAEVDFGHCLCGLAAQSGEIVYASSSAEQHEPCDACMAPHAHYAIPILLPENNEVIGVLNLYTKQGNRLQEIEEKLFLPALSKVLAGIIKRKQAELALIEAHALLERRVEERTEQLAEANTSLVSAKNILEQQNEELKALDKMKDGLVRDVTHELKTPVAKLRMQVDLLHRVLTRRGLNEECDKYIKTMESSIKRQESVIHNILDLARLESGGRQYRSEALAVNRLLKDVLKDFQPLFEAHKIKVEKDLKEIQITSDRDMLFHVFSNLINNAIKYRRKDGHAEIRVTMEPLAEQLCVLISDNGIGITTDEQEKVFNRFYQASISSEGSGVGLTIAQMIVNDLGGAINVASEGRKKGLSVSVMLPLNKQS